jgi:hypothetical protein
MLDMADDHPFLLPVVIDGTPESSARVPDAFRERQWTRWSGDEVPFEFVERVRHLVGTEVSYTPNPSSATPPPQRPSRIKVVRIEKIPAARSSAGTLLYLAASVVIGIALSTSFMWLTAFSAKTPFAIYGSDLGNGRRIASALMPPSKDNEDLWKLLSVGGKQELIRLVKEGPGDSDELTAVLTREFNALIEGTHALDNAVATSPESLALSNRRLLESRFPEEVSTLLEPRSFIASAKAKFLEKGGLRRRLSVVVLALTIFSVAGYFVYKPIAIRYSFEDSRHVDQVLAYLMGELGFRRSARGDGTLIYRPTLSTFLLWGPVSFAVRIDGASMVISGPSISMKRLSRALEGFIDTPALAG